MNSIRHSLEVLVSLMRGDLDPNGFPVRGRSHDAFLLRPTERLRAFARIRTVGKSSVRDCTEVTDGGVDAHAVRALLGDGVVFYGGIVTSLLRVKGVDDSASKRTAAASKTMPSQKTMEFLLQRDHGFNPLSVPAFIRDFKSTIEFAKLVERDKLPESENEQIFGVASGAATDDRVEPKTPPITAPPERGTAMPAVQTENSALPPLDVTIPLGFGRRAILRIPSVISQKEYELILKSVRENMENYHEMIVAPPVADGGL